MGTLPLAIRLPGRTACRWLASAVLSLLLVLGAHSQAAAQQSAVTGRVVDAESGEPVSGVVVELYLGARNIRSATTGADGAFRISDVAVGRYSLVFSTIGYETQRLDGINVETGGVTASVGTVVLTSIVFRLNPIVVTASREQEKALDSPASVYTVDSEAIEDRPANSTPEHVQGLPGVDFATTGLSQHNVVARGFNNVFSGALFVLTDNRWASVPSLRYNAYNIVPTTNYDIDRIEFVLGPGSALYGPNVDKGVMHIITRSPLDHQGTTVAVTGGEREVAQGDVRHAGLFNDNVGYKLSAMYFRGRDWRLIDPFEDEDARDFDAERFTADARVDYRLDDQSTLIVSGGLARMISSIELTGLGAAQADNWTYTYAQARFRRGNLFAQSYVNFSDAGDTYLLRTEQPVSDNSLLYVGQVQHGASMGERQRFIYGADVIRTVPKTKGTIHGANEDDDDIYEVGGYVQSETQLSPMFDLVLAGRADYHNVVDEVVFSPRAAIVFKPTQEHSIRATYNRAFSQPTSVNLFLDLPSLERSDIQPFGVHGSGVPTDGFQFRWDDAGRPMMRTFWADFVPGVEEEDFLPLDATLLWPVAVEVFRQETGIDLSTLPAPTADDVQTQLRALNQTTRVFSDVDVSTVQDIDRLKPTITNIIELGYKGLIAERLLLGIDGYYTKIEDFIGPLRTESPTVFLDRASLETYLAQFLPPEQAAQIAAGMAGISGDTLLRGIPLATITPENTTSTDPADILLAYRQYGEVDLWGADVGVTFLATDWLSFSGSYSFTSDNLFENLDGVGDIALNSPQNKASLAAHYRNERLGLRAEVRGRWVDSFPVSSGVYEGMVSSYELLDAHVSFALPISRSTEVSLLANNILDNRHIEMVGAPELGRLLLLRVRQGF